jgi:hypothetical protein
VLIARHVPYTRLASGNQEDAPLFRCILLEIIDLGQEGPRLEGVTVGFPAAKFFTAFHLLFPGLPGLGTCTAAALAGYRG